MDMQNVRFLWASDEINAHAEEYWSLVMDVARVNNLPRIQVRFCCLFLVLVFFFFFTNSACVSSNCELASFMICPLFLHLTCTIHTPHIPFPTHSGAARSWAARTLRR